MMAGPERALTWAGEPLNTVADQAPYERKDKLDTVAVNGPDDVLDWDAIDWRLHEQNVVRLRRRIFKATWEQDWATVRSLQKNLTHTACYRELQARRRRLPAPHPATPSRLA